MFEAAAYIRKEATARVKQSEAQSICNPKGIGLLESGEWDSNPIYLKRFLMYDARMIAAIPNECSCSPEWYPLARRGDAISVATPAHSIQSVFDGHDASTQSEEAPMITSGAPFSTDRFFRASAIANPPVSSIPMSLSTRRTSSSAQQLPNEQP